jgi:hypothetical protein
MKPDHDKYEIELSGLSSVENTGVSLFFIIMFFAAVEILFRGDPDGCDAIKQILFNIAGM